MVDERAGEQFAMRAAVTAAHHSAARVALASANVDDTSLEDSGGTASLSILFIGDRDWPDFQAAALALASMAESRFVRDCQAAQARLKQAAACVDLVVLAQRFPGEFATNEVEALRASAPLARFVSLLGSWCEGEMRTGAPLAGSLRLYWHQFVARVARGIARAKARDCPAWGLPQTATEEDRLLAQIGNPREPSQTEISTDRFVVVCSSERAMSDFLLEALATAGYAAARWESPRGMHASAALAAICDLGGFDEESRMLLARLRERVAAAPIIALIGFPRADDVAAALEAGATAVLSKPFEIRDLLWLLDQAQLARPST